MSNLDLLLFLGSGASAPFGLPTMEQLVYTIEKEIEKKSSNDTKRLYNTVKDFSIAVYKYVDLELIFTILNDIAERRKFMELGITSTFLYRKLDPTFKKADKFLEQNQSIAHTLLKTIKAHVRKKLILTSKQEQEIRKTHSLFFESLKEKFSWKEDANIHCSIYTTNYDRVIETYFADNTYLSDLWEREMGTDILKVKNADVDRSYYKLIKLHGSLDWFQLEDGRIVKLEVAKKMYLGKKIENEMMIFPIQQKDLYLYPWYNLFRAFKLSLNQAKNWLVIGYNFNDEYIRNIFLQEFRDEHKFVIVSPNALDLKSKFAKLEKSKSINFIPLKFDDDTISEIVSDLQS